jgi:2-oxoglutarate ferredoxin oxidoreductase subunit delta
MFQVKIEKDKCKSCSLCILYCPTKNLTVSKDLNKRGVNYVEIKEENKCIGCGFCFLMCPDGCIEIIEQ